MASDFSGYKRACARYFENHGIDPKTVNGHLFDTKADKWRAWCVESVFAAIEAFEASDPILALRCTLQAADYVGRLGGYWPTPSMGDAFIALRNELELAVACSVSRTRKAG